VSTLEIHIDVLVASEQPEMDDTSKLIYIAIKGLNLDRIESL